MYSLCGIQENLSESQVSSLDSKQNGLFTFTSPRSLGSWKHRGQIARTCMQPPTQGQLSPFHEGLAQSCCPLTHTGSYVFAELFLEQKLALKKKNKTKPQTQAGSAPASVTILQEADE